MPMSAYVGLTGSGKSFNAVKHVILPALKKKRKVFTNIPMKKEECLRDFDFEVVQFKTEDLIENKNWFTEVFESGAIFVFDEVWRLWPSGMSVSKVPTEHKTFLAEHRHLVGKDGFSTEIVLITQDLAQLATFSTQLVDFTYVSNSLEDLGMKNRIRVDVYKNAYKGLKTSPNSRQREFQDKIKWEQGDAGYYYVSQTKSESAEIGTESRSDNRFNVFGGWKFKLMGIGLVFFLFALYFLSSSFLENSAFIDRDEKDLKQVSKAQPEQKKLEFEEVKRIKPTNNVAEIPKENIDDGDVISLARHVYVLGKINNSYYFKITKSDNIVTLKDTDLASLGYELQPINDCLIKAKGYKKTTFLYCQDNDNLNDFIRSPI